jgi:hypothetical protein
MKQFGMVILVFAMVAGLCAGQDDGVKSDLKKAGPT